MLNVQHSARHVKHHKSTTGITIRTCTLSERLTHKAHVM